MDATDRKFLFGGAVVLGSLIVGAVVAPKETQFVLDVVGRIMKQKQDSENSSDGERPANMVDVECKVISTKLITPEVEVQPKKSWWEKVINK